MFKIDYSQLHTYQMCPMRYYLQYVLNLKKRSYDERDVDLEFGSRVHKCLEMYHRIGDTDFVKYWEDFVDLPPEIEVHKTKVNGIKLCQAYIEHYKDKDIGTKILSLEEVGEIALDNDIVWIVKIDKVIERLDNIYFVDYKTKGEKIPYNYFLRFSPHMQISGYSYYTYNKYGQCSGGIIDVLMSGYRKRKYLNEPAGFHCQFQREVINRDQKQIADFKDNAVFWIKKLQREVANKEIGKNEGACWQYRGCPYIALCLTSHGMDLDPEISEVMYEVADNKEYLNESNEDK